MSGVLTGSGPVFIFAEVEIFRPGSADYVPEFQALGVLPVGTLETEAQPLGDSSTFLVSDAGYVTRDTDVGGLRVFAPLLVSVLEIDRQVDLAPNGQGAGVGWGSLNFVNSGDLNDIALTRNTDGRSVSVRIGRKVALTRP